MVGYLRRLYLVLSLEVNGMENHHSPKGITDIGGASTVMFGMSAHLKAEDGC
jgi:hypothetical protein